MRPFKEVIKEFRIKHGNQRQVAAKIGISSQLLGHYESGRHAPKMDFFKRWKNTFGEDLMEASEDSQKETNVSHGTKKHAQVHETIKNKENRAMNARETFYTELIENNQEYSLLPKAILRDYKMIPDKLIDLITQSKDEVNRGLLEKNELLVMGYEARLQKLEMEKEELRRQISTKDKQK